MMKTTNIKNTNDGQIAVDIIRTWKADPAIRAEFGNICTYAAYVQGKGLVGSAAANRQAVMPGVIEPTPIKAATIEQASI